MNKVKNGSQIFISKNFKIQYDNSTSVYPRGDQFIRLTLNFLILHEMNINRVIRLKIKWQKVIKRTQVSVNTPRVLGKRSSSIIGNLLEGRWRRVVEGAERHFISSLGNWTLGVSVTTPTLTNSKTGIERAI